MLDVGCGDGFHLPLFTGAASVSGVEPHAPLVARARTRLADRRDIRVLQAGAAALPLPDASVDLVHARTAYFFGRGLRAGSRRGAARPAARRGDRDRRPRRHRAPVRRRGCVPTSRATTPPPRRRSSPDRGFTLRRIPTVWRFPDRATRDAVLRIEFSRDVAERAIAATVGLEIPVGYRLHVRPPTRPDRRRIRMWPTSRRVPRSGRYRRWSRSAEMGRFVRRQVEVPGSAVLALAGGAAWLAGSAALPSGAGTVVLAARPRGHRVADGAGDPRRRARVAGRGWTATDGAV